MAIVTLGNRIHCIQYACIASLIAPTVAGTRVPPSYCASFRAARIAAAISSTRFRPSSTAIEPEIAVQREGGYGEDYELNFTLRQGDNVWCGQEGVMSVEENVQLMRRWFKEVWNEGKMQTIHELFAPDGVGNGEHEDGKPLRGPADFVPFAERIRGAFPDIHMVVEDAFGADDKVAVRWSATMTHRGDHLGMPASGKRVRVTGRL
jgi:steroid delta-isomerase-like uncharacterized protein